MKELASVKFLKTRKIPFEVKQFDTDISKGVINIAQFFGIDPTLVLKTIILQGRSGKTYLCLVESNEKIDLKQVKRITDEKDVTMASPEVILEQTGFQVGAIPPFGLKNTLPVFISSTVKDQNLVTVGAGEYGKEIFLSAQDLQKATNGTFADITKKQTNEDITQYGLDDKYALRDQSALSPKIFLKDIAEHEGKEVELMGWIYNKRSSGGLSFLQLRDGTGFIQIVAEKESVGAENFSRCKGITVESSVKVSGKVRKEERAPSGYEISLNSIDIIQLASEYPLQKKSHGIEFLLDHRHLWLRSSKQWAIQRVRNTIINAIYEHLNFLGFIKIDSPILTPNACEGTTTLFPVP